MQLDTPPTRPSTASVLLAWFERIGRFYVEGFRHMTVGKTLWLIIIVKLIIMFAILKPFFFKYELSGMQSEEKQTHVGNNLIERKAK
ncbi:MAG: DUF4492 domain-containing protein [Bacteroidales bacterium]|nr:DUF4492 domain-containing protein [Bacteroidales bacterium]